MTSQMLAAVLALARLGASRAYPEVTVVPPEEMDVFVPVHHPSCVASKMVEHLNIYLGPRRILVATAGEHCSAVEAYAENVRCLDEDRVLPGNITKGWVAGVINRMLRLDVADSQVGYGGHSTAGWYMQQLLKLGVVNSPLLLDDPISPIFLVWDADMILVNKFEVYDAEGRTPLMAGGTRHSFSFLQQEAELADSCNYHVVFRRLTGMDTVSPPSGGGYVPHHMVMRKAFARELIETFGGKEQWALNILGSSCGNGDGFAFCQCGFSEYYSYASFAKLNHPGAVFDRAANYTRYHSKSCCPHQRHFKQHADKLVIGFEQGACDEGAGAGSELLLRQPALRR